MNNSRVRAVQETDLGVYVWLMPNGQIMGDSDGNFLSLGAKEGDQSKISNITTVAHDVLNANGVEPSGRAYFLPGRRKITDEEYEEQKQRMQSGLIPDEFDLAAMKEELRRHGGRND